MESFQENGRKIKEKECYILGGKGEREEIYARERENTFKEKKKDVYALERKGKGKKPRSLGKGQSMKKENRK